MQDENTNKQLTETKPQEEVKDAEAQETEEQAITRMAQAWIANGNKNMPPAKIRERVYQLQPSSTRTRALRAQMHKEKVAIVKRQKMDLFMDAFIKSGGNATQAAMDAFNPPSRHAASIIGSRYLQQAKLLGRFYMEEKGYHMGKMLDVALKKMEEGRSPDWWDRLMKIAEYSNPLVDKKSGPQVVNIFQTQKQDADDFGFAETIEGEEVEDDAEQI